MRIRASLLAVALFASCATSPSESELDPALYKSSEPVIGKDPRGLSFIVFPTDAVPSWVKVTQDHRSYLAWSPRVDDRTAMLVPISAFVPKRGAKIEPLHAPEFPGIGVGEGSNVAWIGVVYNGPVAIVPAELSRADLTGQWVAAVATLVDGQLVDVQGDLPAQFLAIPQPAVTRACKLAGLDNLTVQVAGCQTLSPTTVTLVRGATRFHADPLFTRLGANLVAWQAGDTYYSGVSAPTVVNGVPLSVVAEPWPVQNADNVAAAATGQWAAQSGQPLIAAYWLTSTGTDPVGTRVSDLYAAAGRGLWAQIQLTMTQVGLTPESALSLARAAMIEDRLEDAQVFAQLAFDEGTRLYEPASGLVRGQAAGLLAVMAGNQSKPELAAQWARKAAESYAEVGDEIRAASMELEAAGWWAQSGDLSAAEKNASDARSRFFHGGAIWHSALAEARLAEIIARVGKSDEASTLAGYAVDRLVGLGDPLAAARARVVQHFIAGERLALEEYMHAAVASDDPISAREAASFLALLDLRVEGKPGVIGALSAADSLGVDAVSRFRIADAWRAVCALGPSVDAGLDAEDPTAAVYAERCRLRPEDAGVAAVDRVLAEGFAALKTPDLALARRNLQTARELGGSDPNASRRIRLLEAAIARTAGEDIDGIIAQMSAEIAATTEPALVARSLGQLAADAATSQQLAIAVALLDEAIGASTRAGQLDERRAHALTRIELLHQDGRFNEVIVAANKSQNWFESAGVRGTPARIRAASLAHDSARRLGQTATPPDLSALSPAEAEQTRHALAQLAYLRADFDEASQWANGAGSGQETENLRVLIQANKDFNAAGLQAIALVLAGERHPDLVNLAAFRAQTPEEFTAIKSSLEASELMTLVSLRDASPPATTIAELTDVCTMAMVRLQSGAPVKNETEYVPAEQCESSQSPRSLELRAAWGDDIDHDLYRRQAEISRSFRPMGAELRAAELTRLEEAVTAARGKGGDVLKKAFRAWITYEVSTGRASDAVQHIDQASAMVLELAPDAQIEIDQLRLDAMGAAQQWGPAFQHALRVMAEVKLEGNAGAELALTAARLALVVGAREVARPWLVTAASLVRKNPELTRRIQTTAELFFLVP